MAKPVANISTDRPPDKLAAQVAAGPLPSHKDLGISLLVFLFCLLVYNANLRLIATGDSYPSRYLPFAIVHYRTLMLDPVLTTAAQGRKIVDPPRNTPLPRDFPFRAYWLVGWNGHHASLYPVITPLLLSPLYLPAVAYLDLKGWEPWRLDRVARVMEKLSASMLVALSAALLYLLLRRRTGRGGALLLTAAYAFGSSTWTVSSQALWQHGPAELLLVCLLLAVTSRCTTGATIATGLFCALVACNRPHDTVYAAAVGIYGLWWAGRKAPLLIAAALLPLPLLLAYNMYALGNYGGGYGLVVVSSFSLRAVLAQNPLEGAAGLLFSPARGLFVFSPFLLFVLAGCREVLRDPATRFLTVALCIAMALQFTVYANNDFRQGAMFGPRWLISTIPLLVWMLPPVFDSLRGAGRIAFVSACLIAIAIQTVGAFWYTGTSNGPIYAIEDGPNYLRAAWDARNSPFLAELRHPRPPADLAAEARGSIDIARTTDGQDLGVASGKPIAVEGWTLVDGRTPREVVIMLDGQVVAATENFFVRFDVNKTLGVSSPSGWRITISARDLDEGEHRLAVFTRVGEGGTQFFVVDRRFTTQGESPSAEQQTPGDDLALDARRAAAFLSGRQQAPGYWLTAYTRAIRYEQPQQELNTFLPAVLIDMLDPVAGDARLAGNFQRARDFLAGQIEDTGLVRYHGRPEAVGSLGCVITADADDTALAWRIAPGSHPERLPMALSTLKRYRTAEGLYRTWLAPRSLYQCLDPGKDPDPADVTIQMHVLMFLAKADPPAARELCSALQRTIADDRIWVYYRRSPILPILRQTDLQREGCALELPPSRLRPASPEQAVWVTTAQMLRSRPDKDSAAVTDLLRRLALDDFRAVRQSPPLLYHNDLTASVPRFYWSEEMGYALWLRLYFEHRRGGVK